MGRESIGEYLEVTKEPDRLDRKTSVWTITSKSGSTLGVVWWFGRWRQYCFEPQPDTVFNVSCLDDIARFIQKAMQEWRATQ